MLRVVRATFLPVLRVVRATFRPVLWAARATFRPVLRAVRAVLRVVVLLVAIVFLPFCFDVAPIQGALTSITLHFCFAVAYGKSITFMVGDAGDPQQISRSCHHQVQLTVTSAARRSAQERTGTR